VPVRLRLLAPSFGDNMLIAGNKNYGLGAALFKLLPSAEYISRSSGHDLTQRTEQDWFAEQCLHHDQIIICSALHSFNQTVLLDIVYKACAEKNHTPHIICIGSTTDRLSDGKPWMYNAEKKALRDYCNTLALGGVWKDRPKITYVSLGTMSNNQHKHPDRKCLDIDQAAEYIKWICEQPKNININEISIDPMQDQRWHND
jgi:hypothetical protein